MSRPLNLALLSALLCPNALYAADVTLGAGQYRLIGASFDVTPVEQTVPVGVSAGVKTVFTGSAQALAATGARVAAELSGPGVPSPVTISAAPGEDLVVPPLSIKGEHRLDNIRLTDGAGAAVPAVHPTARIVVSDIFITRITSRALTSQELAARGVVVNDSNFKAYSFALGLAIQGRTINIEIPTVVQTRDGYQPLGPPIVHVENRDERFVPPTVIAVPLKDDMPPGGPPDPEVLVEDEASPQPVFGLLVFPGTIRFLNQFFSVILMVQNGSATGSTLSLHDVSTTISLPAASLRLSKTIPAVPDGSPVPVRSAGADNVLGTADDLSVLVAQATGQAEFVTEGLRVGTHEVLCELEATLEGLANQPARRLTGRARGSVLVRDPSFGLTFNHPDVIRSGEEYELRVTVANTSTVLANQVSISIDAASLTGAVPVDVPQGIDPSAQLGDLPPGQSKLAKFLLRATRTGRVVASAFTSDGPVVGSLRLRTGVTNDGIPLSPDSFVFPRVVSLLPPQIVDPATALIGIAHGLATVDPTAPGSGCGVLGEACAAPFADGVVQDRVSDLVAAARRAGLGEPLPAVVADLAFSWLGEATPSPGFDRVRRSNNHGRDLEAGIGAILSSHLQTAGASELEKTLLDCAVASLPPLDPANPLAGPIWAILDEGGSSDPTARLYLGDPATGVLTGLRPGEKGYLRGTQFAGLFALTGSAGGELGIIARPGPSGVVLGIEGKRTGTVGLTAFFPDGAGGFRRARFDGIAIAAGSVTNIHVMPGAVQLQAISATDVLRTAPAVAVLPSPFGPYGAVQDLDANPLGKAVSLVFNRPMAMDGASEIGRYRLPTARPDGSTYERGVNGAFPQGSDPRHLILVSETIISPFRPGDVVGTNVPARDGSVWSGTLPITPKLSLPGGTVAGRVIGPDGTPLPNSQVRLSESATDDLSGEVFAATTSVTRTDATGAFFFDYVRKQDGKPFRIDSLDAITGSKGFAVGSIRMQGQTVQVDVVLQGRGTVTGTVVDGSGVPLSGIIVRCSSENDPGFRTAQLSRANGAFSFVSVPVGAIRLQAEDPTTKRTAYATVALSAPGAVADRQLVIAQLPRTSLRGVVLHGRDGSAYSDVYVAGYGQLGEYFGVRQTGADGKFSFDSAPAGNVRLELFDTSISQGSIFVQTVTLIADQPAEVTLTIVETTPSYGSVAGVVRKVAGGAPAPAAGIVVFARNTGLRTTTAADGAYRLDGVPVGQQTVSALDPATGRSVSGSTGVQQDVTSTLDLQFADTSLGSVVGVVVDQQGQPKSGVNVQIFDEGPPITVVAQSATAVDGSFTLLNVPPGAHRVQATIPEQRGSVTLRNAGAVSVTVPGPGAAARTTIQLRGWATVTGRVIARVRDRNGDLHDNPVFAPVELLSSRFSDGLNTPDPESGPLYRDGPSPYSTVNTDPETGAFRFENVRGGAIRVVARNPFYGEKTQDFGFVQGDTSRGPVDLVFDGNLGVVDGYLFNADGTPIVGGHLTLTGEANLGMLEATTRPAGSSNGAGYFVFPLVPFSRLVRLRFAEPVNGIDRFAEGSISISAQAPTARVTLRALGVGAVNVRVVQPSGNDLVPVAGAQVRIDELRGLRRSFTATADGSGTVSFSKVTEGDVTVLARSGLLSGRSSVFGSGEGFALDAVVRLSGTARVFGVVRNPADSSPARNINVVLASLGGGGLGLGPLAAATTAADGSFDISDVPAVAGAIYRVDAEDSGTMRRGQSNTLILSQGDQKQADITLNALGSVTGHLTTFDGATALTGAQVTVWSFEPIPGSEKPRTTELVASTDASGIYRVDGVPSGTIQVRSHDDLTGLSASGSGTLSAEEQVVTIDLRATPTGRVQGIVRKGDGTPLDEASAVPTVTVHSSRIQVVTAKAYDFAGVDATRGFTLEAREPVSPFHSATTGGTVSSGELRTIDLRYGPFGTVRVHVRKPDPASPGSFLPAAGLVTIYQGGPYANRFPSLASFRTDAQGDLSIINVGGGFGLSVRAVEDGTGAVGSATVSDFTTDGQVVDATIVVEPRGIVRGRVLRPDGVSPASGAAIRLYLSSYNDSPLSPPGATVGAVTGADGLFEMRDVPLRGFFVIAGTASPFARVFAEGRLTAGMPVLNMGDLVLDDAPPALVSVEPPDGSTGIGLAPTIRFTFSEPLWPYGADGLWRAAQVQFTSSTGQLLSGFVSSQDDTGRIVTIIPTSPLPGATLYEVRLPGSLKDRNLLEIGADAVIRFSTADLTDPVVVSSAPVANQVQVGVLVNPSVVLSKAIDPTTLGSGTHLNRLDAPSGPVAISPALQADGRTIVLNPSANLVSEAEYEIVLDALKDMAGNALHATTRIPFFTRDDHAPVPAFDSPDTAEPLEGTTHTYTVRFADDDVKTVTLHLVAPTGEIWNATNGIVSPARADRFVTYQVLLPRISEAGGTSIRARVWAIDFGGNSSAAVDLPLTLKYDAPPTIVSASASASTLKVGTTFTVSVAAADDHALAGIEATPSAALEAVSTEVTSSSATSRSEVRTYRARLDASPGQAGVSFTARDDHGQLSAATLVSVTIQPDDPPTVSIVAPATGSSFLSGSSIPVTFSVSDDLGVASLVLQLGNTQVTIPNPSGTGTANLVAPAVASAQTLDLTATATDSTGHSVYDTRSITLRPDGPPTVVVTAPAAGLYFKGGSTVLVNGTLSDDNDRATLTATLGTASRTIATVGSFSFSLGVPVVTASTSMTLALRAQDNTGHSADPVDITIVVDPDTVDPTIAIGSPSVGGTVIGGKAFSLVATASDDVAVTAFRYRVNGGAFTTVSGRVIAVQIPTPGVSVPTPLTIDIEAEDASGHVARSNFVVTVVPNQPPTLTVTQPSAAAVITAGTSFTVAGQAADDSGIPTTTVTFGGTTKSATSTTFALAFTAPAVSVSTPLTILATAQDPEGNTSTPVSVTVTVVPDVGGTPTVKLNDPGPAAFLVGESTTVSIAFADNVGLSSGSAEVTGAFTSGPRSFTLSGTSSVQSIDITPAGSSFGETARIKAKNVDLGGHTATLDVTLPVAYHRLELPLPAGPLTEGSQLTGAFRISPPGRQRAAALRFEIGTVSGQTFSVVACTQKTAPLAELETISVPVPVGRTGLYVRSVLVETTGAQALAARVDGKSILLDSLVTSGDTANPVVSITSPTTGTSARSGDLVPVSVTASDDTRLDRIDVLFGGISKTCIVSPCILTFFAPIVTASGPQSLSATVRDGAGKTASTSVSITVSPRSGGNVLAGPTDGLVRGDGRAPTIRFLTPHVSPAPVAPNAPFRPALETADADGIERIEVFLDGGQEPCLVIRPSLFTREGCLVPDTLAGTLHTLRAVAYDRSGEKAAVETDLIVTPGIRLCEPGTLPAGLDVSGETLYVEADTRLEADLDVASLVVRDGGRLMATYGRPLSVKARHDVFLDTGSIVSATAAGPGPVIDEPELDTPAGEGGAHGGDAGSRIAFDSFSRPEWPGASGGDSADGAVRGSRGGGVIAIGAERVVLAGTVEADGEPQLAAGSGGIGAGGSIRIEASNGILATHGEVPGIDYAVITAAGGRVTTDAEPEAHGAGGRIALVAPVVEPSAVDVAGSVGAARSGAAGTVFIRDRSHPNGRLLLRGGLPEPTNGGPARVETRPSHIPSVGCGLLETAGTDRVRAPGQGFSLGLAGLWIEIAGSPSVRLQILDGQRDGFRLNVAGRDHLLAGLSRRPYCGIVVLDELSLEDGARAVFGDRLETPRQRISIDSTSSLEQP